MTTATMPKLTDCRMWEVEGEINYLIEEVAAKCRGVVCVHDEAGGHGVHQQTEICDDDLLVGGEEKFVLAIGSHEMDEIPRKFTFEHQLENDWHFQEINVEIKSAEWANGGDRLVVVCEWDGGGA
jgi:hypothetical protein